MASDRQVRVRYVQAALGHLRRRKPGKQPRQLLGDELLVETGDGFVSHAGGSVDVVLLDLPRHLPIWIGVELVAYPTTLS